MNDALLPIANQPLLRLLLVDDHTIVRDGLRANLQAAPGLQVVAEAAGLEAALTETLEHAPDVVLMDIGLRGANGIEGTRALRRLVPAPRVLILTMYDNAEYVRAALAAGAGGYVLKDCSAQEIVAAIWAVHRGQTYLAAAVAAAALGSSVAEARGAASSGPSLTPREREVLALIAEGLSSRDIGERLAMGVRTVETHRTNLRRKLELASPAALVRYAVERRWHGP